MAFFLFIGGLAAQSLSTYVRTDKPEAVIDIRAGQQSSFRIPRTVYGIYTENGGNGNSESISAQLLENPSLEDFHASLQVMNARFKDPAFVQSLNEGLPLPWQPLRDVGKRYESIFGGGAANSDRFIRGGACAPDGELPAPDGRIPLGPIAIPVDLVQFDGGSGDVSECRAAAAGLRVGKRSEEDHGRQQSWP